MFKSQKAAVLGVVSSIVLSAISNLVLAQSFKPVDEATKNPHFLKFRNQLKMIIAKKDAKALLAIVDKNIHMSYGANNGITEFKKEWKLDKPHSPLWSEMSTVLSLGGQFNREGEFVAPYIFSAWPEDKDSFENVAIIGKNVRIHAKASLSSAIISKASYEILALDTAHNNTQQKWVAVKKNGGKTGYIAEQYVRSPIDYRAFFKKNKGQWKLVTFIAGD